MTFAAMLRVKNESRWIRRVLESLLPITERIHVFDDRSTDDTREIVRSLPHVRLIESPFDNLNEARDKNYLLEQVRQAGPVDWVIHIDGDEILEPGAGAKMALRAVRSVGVLSFRVCYMWDRDDQWRTDGVYGRFWRPSMFRFGDGAGLTFRPTKNGGNFHCGNVPAGARGSAIMTDVRLLHMGYVDREMRIRKLAWYNQQDPGNESEDCYRHIAQGDLPEIPADARLRHAGPLTLQPFQI